VHHLTGTLLGTGPYQALTPRAQWFVNSLPAVPALLILYGLVELLRPVLQRDSAVGGERERVRALLERWAHNPVSHLSLLSDKRYFWIGEEACVAYRLEGRVALALGDPIGPPELRARCVVAFAEFCERQDWVCALYQTETDEPYRDLGYTLAPIGLDALVQTERFSLEGKERASLRYAVRRCQREGITFSFMPALEAWHEHGPELREVSDAWRKMSGRRQEMGFSLGGLGTLSDHAITVGLARASDGGLLCFVSWLPAPARRCWTLDLMRRRPEGPSGVMESLIVQSIEEARNRGIAEVSLGLAPMAVQGPPDSWLTGALRVAYSRLDQLYHYRTLRSFKAKFGPAWESRYLAVTDAALLPEALAALVRAHLSPIALAWWLPRRRSQAEEQPTPLGEKKTAGRAA
jgi:phosphatidylglycerol lysyltransferase